MKSSMVDYLKVVAPYFGSELVSPEAMFRMQELTQRLPPFSITIVECRLGKDRPQVDLSFCVPQSSLNLPEEFLIHPEWQFLRHCHNEWVYPTGFLHQSLQEIWLEFDFNCFSLEIPIPCIVCLLNPLIVRDYYLVKETTIRLHQKPVSLERQSNLEHFLKSIMEGASIWFLGAMQSRPNKSMKVTVAGITPSRLLDYLSKVGWNYATDSLDRLARTLESFVDEIRLLHFEVSDTILPQIGFECYLKGSPQSNPRWQLFLDYLVETGLCTPGKLKALLAWPGFSQKADRPDLWPESLTGADLLLGYKGLSVFKRNITHIKIVYRVGSPLEAKAYLAFEHCWLDVGEVRQ